MPLVLGCPQAILMAAFALCDGLGFRVSGTSWNKVQQ
jgi:hypothetical protein